MTTLLKWFHDQTKMCRPVYNSHPQSHSAIIYLFSDTLHGHVKQRPLNNHDTSVKLHLQLGLRQFFSKFCIIYPIVSMGTFNCAASNWEKKDSESSVKPVQKSGCKLFMWPRWGKTKEALVGDRMEETVVSWKSICIHQETSYIYFSILVPSVHKGQNSGESI